MAVSLGHFKDQEQRQELYTQDSLERHRSSPPQTDLSSMQCRLNATYNPRIMVSMDPRLRARLERIFPYLVIVEQLCYLAGLRELGRCMSTILEVWGMEDDYTRLAIARRKIMRRWRTQTRQRTVDQRIRIAHRARKACAAYVHSVLDETLLQLQTSKLRWENIYGKYSTMHQKELPRKLVLTQCSALRSNTKIV